MARAVEDEEIDCSKMCWRHFVNAQAGSRRIICCRANDPSKVELPIVHCVTQRNRERGDNLRRQDLMMNRIRAYTESLAIKRTLICSIRKYFLVGENIIFRKPISENVLATTSACSEVSG